MRHSVHHIENTSFSQVAKIVEEVRGDRDGFGTAALSDDILVSLEGHDAITFPKGTTLAYYGSRALLLATLRNTEHALAIGRDSSVELYSHNEPSDDELVKSSDTFVKWMETSWNIPS
jgi:hypothetical protein